MAEAGIKMLHQQEQLQRLSIPKWLIGCFVIFFCSPLIHHVGIHTKWTKPNTTPCLPYPPQMLSSPSWWLQFKWLQPPPRAPDWLFNYYEHYNLLANVGCPLHDEEWHQRAIHEDQQAAALLPPGPRGGGPLLGACACADCAYRDWKEAVNVLWEDEYEALLKEPAARARHEEAARRQQLLDEQAARARQQELLPFANAFAYSARASPRENGSGRLLPFVNAFASSARASPRENGSGRLLPFANAFASSARALLKDNGWPNLLPNANRRPLEPSTFGSAAAASMSGSTARLHDASNMKPLSHACTTGRTAAGMRQSPKSAVATRRPPNALPRWWKWCSLRSAVATRRRRGQGWLRRQTNDVATRGPQGLRSPRHLR